MPYKDPIKKALYFKNYGKKYREDGRGDLEKRREITRMWRREHPVRRYLVGIKSRAKRNGMEFNLTEEDFVFPETCPILRIPIFMSEGQHTSNTPSVDRVDNLKGYTKDNIRIISSKANKLKGDMSIEDVERLLAYMKGEL